MMYPISTTAAGADPIVYVDEGGIADPNEADKVFSEGFNVLQIYMKLLSQQAGDYHKQMKRNGEISNESQKMVNSVDSLISEIDLDEKHGDVFLTQELRDYFESHPNIWTGSKDLYEEWSKGQLVEARGRIQNYATANSDAVSQDQLQVQKIMQTYNVTVSLMNSLQTLMGDMNKMVAQTIRW